MGRANTTLHTYTQSYSFTQIHTCRLTLVSPGKCTCVSHTLKNIYTYRPTDIEMPPQPSKLSLLPGPWEVMPGLTAVAFLPGGRQPLLFDPVCMAGKQEGNSCPVTLKSSSRQSSWHLEVALRTEHLGWSRGLAL